MVQLMPFFAVIYSFSARDPTQLLARFKQAVGLKAEGGRGPPSRAAWACCGQPGIAPERAADLERLLSDLRASEGRTWACACAS